MQSETKAKQKKALHVEVLRQMITLSTSGFGLVAALAWNNVIQEAVNQYVKTWFPNSGGIIPLLSYALLITILAVLVTIQLSKFLEKLENKQ